MATYPGALPVCGLPASPTHAPFHLGPGRFLRFFGPRKRVACSISGLKMA